MSEAEKSLEDSRSRIKRYHSEEADLLALLREAEELIEKSRAGKQEN